MSTARHLQIPHAIYPCLHPPHQTRHGILLENLELYPYVDTTCAHAVVSCQSSKLTASSVRKETHRQRQTETDPQTRIDTRHTETYDRDRRTDVQWRNAPSRAESHENTGGILRQGRHQRLAPSTELLRRLHGMAWHSVYVRS